MWTIVEHWKVESEGFMIFVDFHHPCITLHCFSDKILAKNMHAFFTDDLEDVFYALLLTKYFLFL